MTLDDIRLGDTVRLRNGETFVVDSKIDRYIDRDGEHEGPFLSPKGSVFDRYSLGDVVVVARRNERLCCYCGEGVTSPEPNVPYCRDCHYSGRAHEERLSDLIGSLGDLDHVATVAVWHTGGGCFLLAVRLADGRLVTCTAGEAEIPDEGEPWGLVIVAPDEEAFHEWDEERLVTREGTWSNDQLVEEIRGLGGAEVLDLDAERQYRDELATGRDPRD